MHLVIAKRQQVLGSQQQMDEGQGSPVCLPAPGGRGLGVCVFVPPAQEPPDLSHTATAAKRLHR